MKAGSDLGQVRGLGSARDGTHHWWLQRVTAAGNLLLVVWFIVSLLMLPGYEYEVVAGWLSSPLVAIAMVLLTVNVFWHFRLGLQVVLEDYVHNDASKIGLLVLLNFYAIGGAAIAIFSILKLAFGAGG